MCIGDSNVEIEAGKNLATQFPTALIKTVKFRERPSPDEMIKQISLVISKFEVIATSAKNLTIRLERKSQNTNTSQKITL